MPGAEESAHKFLKIFRSWQRELSVSDQDLCKAVQGDCSQRQALVRQARLNANRVGPIHFENKCAACFERASVCGRSCLLPLRHFDPDPGHCCNLSPGNL